MPHHSATVTMLIRRPPVEVFESFVKPEQLREFWLSDASAPLAPGAKVIWHFMVPGAIETVNVIHFDPPNRISFDWSDGVRVDMQFEPLPENTTRASVTLGGFAGDDVLGQVAGAVEGFTIVLCDLKTLLESGRSANLVRDKAELIERAQSG